MAWEIILVPEVEEWFLGLEEPLSFQVRSCIELLAVVGPNLGRPRADHIEGSDLHNLKELRPQTNSRAQIRILFVFDPRRQAILLVAGDKIGHWRRWYSDAIKLAEQRYARYLEIPPEEIA